MAVYKSVLKFIGVLLLIIVPKCSLCLFAVGAAITVCGVEPEAPSSWEYLLVGTLTFLTGSLLFLRVKGRFKLFLRVVLLSGIGIIGSFMMYGLDALFYYVGVGLISVAFLIEIITDNCCKVDVIREEFG